MTKKNRTPNSEQLIAIDHSGGKILSAGAGSGKTFVIIEHIIHIIGQFQKSIPKTDWQIKIPQLMSRLVLMTFTKKAAGEMSIRLMNKVEELTLNETDSFWTIVRQNLSSINVMTISSFCNSLINQGHLEQIPQKVEIVSAIQHKNKINKLFDLWFNAHHDSMEQVLQANSKTLISAMVEIFNSPELRLIWSEPLQEYNVEQELNIFFSEMLQALDLETFFENFDLNANESEFTKSWYVFLNGLGNILTDHGPLTGHSVQSYLHFSRTCGRLPVAPKNLDTNQRLILNQAKELVSFLREIDEDIVHFIDYYEICRKWTLTLKQLFDFIEDCYLSESGFCFADLEYYVCKGLRENSVREKIVKQYDYFIVDEFQDTSFVQYEILRHLTGDEPKRIFCVGDKKQAIYGFRGGELQVFNDCIDFLSPENNIWLKNNFRSASSVIKFNNHFFDVVFPLGIKFEGTDRFSVKMETQSIPNEEFSGRVERIQTTITGIFDTRNIDVDYYEALAIKQQIEKLSEDENIQNICILYRKLQPSAILLDLLAEDNHSFSAQVKVEYAEDPVINLFLRLVEMKLNRGSEKKYESTRFLFETQCEVMGIKPDFEKTSEEFLGQLEIVGLRLAFHKIIYSLGLNNSLYNENSSLIDSICKVSMDKPELAYSMLTSEQSQKYSLNSINVGQGKRIVIMSAHASKGLEYDAVILGGVHSNGNQAGKKSVIGKLPKSFKWKKSFNQKNFFKSPAYFLEAELDKAKDFSESKRLLYVACTRAVKYLGWIDLNYIKEQAETELGAGTNNWIKALRIGSNEAFVQTTRSEIPFDAEMVQCESSLILKDSMGILRSNADSGLGVIAETSVTRLAHLTQCPHKFFLSNIVKLEASANSYIHGFEDEDEAGEIFYSSKERGIQLHQWLSDIITNRKKFEDYSGVDAEKLQWVLIQAEHYHNYEVISEQLIKFPFFGQMISGTPDIVFKMEDELIIWDFKTGNRSDENEEHYWFQLYCYGMAYLNLKRFTPEKKVVLSLVYLDDKKIISQELTSEEITQHLYGIWRKTESLYQVNSSHCPHCEYSSLCHKNANSSS